MIRARLKAHRGVRTALTAVTGAVAFAALTAACGSSASSSSVPAASGAAASQPSATATRPGGTASAGAAKLTGAAATALVTKAIAVGCEGTIALSKTQAFRLVETGGYVWILPSSAYYASLHLDKAALALIAGKYIRVKSTDKQLGDLGRQCTFAGILGSLSKPTGKNYTAVPVTYHGGPAYQVTQSGQQGTAIIANTATITAPSDAESIDGSQLGI